MNSCRRALVFCSFVMAASLSLVAFTQSASGEASDTLPSWVDARPEIKKINDLSDVQFQNAALDPPCTDRTVHEWGYNPGRGSKLDYASQGCLVNMAGGYYDLNNKGIVAYGSDRLQRLKDPLGDDMRRVVVRPAPHTNRLAMVYDSFFPFSNGGAKLKLVDNWMEKFPASVSLDGYSNVERVRTTPYDYELKDSAGNYVQVATQGLEFSANGEWLHVLLRNKSHAVLNVTTHELVPYSGPAESSWAVRNAVSSDGRYVAITHQQNSLKIYDTTKCEAPAGEFVSRNCRFIELLDGGALRNYLGDGVQFVVNQLEFVGIGAALDINLGVNDGTSWKYATYRLKIPGMAPTKYLALGDSFSSGEGAYNYRSPTDFYIDETNYNLCHQSKNSYPYLIQQHQQFDWFNSVACSGATIRDVDYGNKIINYAEKDAQAKTVVNGDTYREEYLGRVFPGYLPQAEFNKEYRPTTATISISGNDIGFGQIVTSCIINKLVYAVVGDCFSGRDEREALAAIIDIQTPKLTRMLMTLKNEMGGSDPKLYVLGYPKVLSNAGVCLPNSPLTKDEINFTNSLVDYLNTAIKISADSVGAQYVDVGDAFIADGRDYRLCGGQSTLAMNGIVLRGNTSKRPENVYFSETFHPNRFGQNLMALKALSQTDGLSKPMPAPINNISELAQKRIALVGDNEKKLIDYTLVYDDGITVKLAPKKQPIELKIETDDTLLPAQDKEAVIEFHSTPVMAGKLPIGADGSIAGSVIVPDSLPVGYHQLHVKYKDISGKVVDKYQYIFIAESEEDYDGDGKPNENDPCWFGRESDVDSDNDGVDDACDDEYVTVAQSTPVNDEPVGVDGRPQSDAINQPSTRTLAMTAPSSSRALGEDTDEVLGTNTERDSTFTQPNAQTDIPSQDSAAMASPAQAPDRGHWSPPILIVVTLAALLAAIIKFVWFRKS